MKTIRLFALFILGILTLTATAQTGNVTTEDLEKAIAEINEECPMAIDEEITLTSVSYDAPNIIMNLKAVVEDEVIEVIGKMEEEMSKMMLEDLTNDDDGIIDICKATKSNLKVVFMNNNGKSATLLIPYTEM